MTDAARRQLVTRGRSVPRPCGKRPRRERSPSSALRPATFDDLAAADLNDLSAADIAMLARIRRTIARVASEMYGG